MAAGILDKGYVFYFLLMAFAFGGFAASAAAIFLIDSYLLLIPACLAFTFFSLQLAGVNHDAGHRAIFRSIRLNTCVGIFTSFCLGIVFENWRTRHNEHHARPNQPSDPDLYVPFLATDVNQLASKGPLESRLLKYQAFYFYPLGALVSFSNRLGTISYFRGRPLNRDDLWRFPLYATGIFFLFVAPFVFFDPLKALFVLLLVHVTSGFYLASCFAPNHKGMTILEDDARVSFLEQQVVTGRSVTGGKLTELILLGLNHQTEHHLFPQTPRYKLRRITPHLQKVCDDNGIHFERASFLKTNRDIIGVLRTVAKEAARPGTRSRLRATEMADDAKALASASGGD
jgi:fatty acid desaturase